MLLKKYHNSVGSFLPCLLIAKNICMGSSFSQLFLFQGELIHVRISGDARRALQVSKCFQGPSKNQFFIHCCNVRCSGSTGSAKVKLLLAIVTFLCGATTAFARINQPKLAVFQAQEFE